MPHGSTHLTPPSDTAYASQYIPLDWLVIDPHQPRKYLPADLRAQITCDAVDSHTAMTILIERAAQGDTVASGYLERLQELVHNMQTVGLQQPLRVSEERNRQAQIRFRIVDGERRYWAHVWMAVVRAATGPVTADPTGSALHIPVILHNSEASADEIQCAQWAANLHREDISAVDYAEVIWQVREDYFSRLAIDRERYLRDLGDAATGLSLHDMAALLTYREVARLTGRTIKRSSLYLYLAIAEKLKAEPKALARNVSMRMRQKG